jgi:hypothetical protein
MVSIDPLTATAVVIATAATDAVYVMFTAAVVARRRVPAASWSSIWYLLSSYVQARKRAMRLAASDRSGFVINAG